MEHLPLTEAVTLVAVTAGLITAIYTAALRKKQAQIELLTVERDAAERRSSLDLRERLDITEKRLEANEDLLVDLSDAIADLLSKVQLSVRLGNRLDQESKLILREFLFFAAKRRLRKQPEFAAELGKMAVLLLDAFEASATKPPTLSEYMARMRGYSDKFFASLPEILDQGKIREQLSLDP